MARAPRVSSRGRLGASDAAAFRGFRRARHLLWLLLGVLVLAGAAVHEWAAHSFAGRVIWLTGMAAALGYPLGRLLSFRCPRCSSVFLVTGGWRDFLALGRILWGTRCGTCAQSMIEDAPPSSGGLSESRPI